MVGGSLNSTHRGPGLKNFTLQNRGKFQSSALQTLREVSLNYQPLSFGGNIFKARKFRRTDFQFPYLLIFDGNVSRNQKSSPHFLANVGGSLFFLIKQILMRSPLIRSQTLPNPTGYPSKPQNFSDWVAVSNIFYVHPYIGEDGSNLTSIFFRWVES